MKVTFVEAGWFTRRPKSRLDDREYKDFQQELLVNPELGDVMPGCGGLRKVRWGQAGRGKGKRSGVRIIYLLIPEAFRIDLFDIYDKDEKDDLSAAEKKALAAMVREVRMEAIKAYKRSQGEK